MVLPVSVLTEICLQGALAKDAVISQSAPTLKLLAAKEELLLVWASALHIMNLDLQIVDCVPIVDFQRESLASVSFHI